MNWSTYEDIWIDPKRMSGAPCLKGTRVTPETILDNFDGALEDGLNTEEAALFVQSNFPTVTLKQVQALIAYREAHEYELQS